MEEQDLLQQLQNTTFACSSLIRLTDGSANYVYRGILMHAMPTRDDALDMESVIVKYSLGHVPGNSGFQLDLSRCSIENAALEYLNQSSLVNMKVKIPVSYFLDLNAHRGIAIQQDFRHSTDIASIMRSTELSGLWAQSQALRTSQEVGKWLRHFHQWASEPEQAVFRSKVSCNGPMQRLKHKVTYGATIDVLKNFPSILGKNIRALEGVKERAELELHDLISGKDGEGRGMIHGDCWMGNVLLSNSSLAQIGSDAATDIIFIGWEMCQFGHRTYDLGHMIGDLYESYHFHDAYIALTMIRGFIDGYGEVNDEMAFRTAIHTGVQLLGWYNRRAPSDAVKGTKEQILSAAKISTHFIVGGWEREKQWFQVTPPYHRAYPPILDSYGISSKEFIAIVDALNIALAEPAPFKAMEVAGDGLGFVPNEIAQGVSLGLGLAAGTGTAATAYFRERKVLERVNRDIFAPKGLVMKTIKDEEVMQRLNTTAKSLDPLQRLQEISSHVQPLCFDVEPPIRHSNMLDRISAKQAAIKQAGKEKKKHKKLEKRLQKREKAADKFDRSVDSIDEQYNSDVESRIEIEAKIARLEGRIAEINIKAEEKLMESSEKKVGEIEKRRRKDLEEVEKDRVRLMEKHGKAIAKVNKKAEKKDEKDEKKVAKLEWIMIQTI
ncbi:hypothetical protein FPANT_4239 [Fusarium pseudoanthophilum]|uniref:Aminoglycoside phosphotransferase domain-containing protein n=1 Tax=Fusarium pseudoanthophilum TaxID=48495 RepID=A0A8H5URX4_9HYPO|nr:hypothetical protein FPANT_4239 [Fusarium pseudoanthophilum]